MNYCPFTRDAKGHLKCPDCHWIYKGKATAPRRNCPKSPDITEAAQRLGITIDDINHWSHALAKWKRAGYPVRTQAEVERIERECCRPCDQYVPDTGAWVGTLVKWITGTATYGRCKVCRCGVSTSRVAVANKLAMATEGCPEGKFEATA